MNLDSYFITVATKENIVQGMDDNISELQKLLKEFCDMIHANFVLIDVHWSVSTYPDDSQKPTCRVKLQSDMDAMTLIEYLLKNIDKNLVMEEFKNGTSFFLEKYKQEKFPKETTKQDTISIVVAAD